MFRGGFFVLSHTILAVICFDFFLQSPIRIFAQANGSNQLIAVALNAANWKSYDVLFRVEKFVDFSPEEHINVVEWFRMTYDGNSDRWLYLKSGEIENVGGRPLLNGPPKAMQAMGLVRNSGKTQFTHQIGSRLLQNDSTKYPLHYLELIDLRFTGLSFSPRLYSRHDEESFDVCLSALRIHANKYKPGDATNDKIRLTRSAGVKGVDTEIVDTVWEIDRESLMPSSIEQFVRDAKAKRRTLDSREEIEWKEIDGIYVPLKITGLKIDLSLSLDKKSVEQASTETNVVFHWFSVNQPLDEEKFDTKYISSVKSFKQHLDPSASRASTFIADENRKIR
jgi:hypothetical protein